jgi:hypothetical protein
MPNTDYIDKLGADLLTEGPDCHIRFKDRSVKFAKLGPEELRSKLNEAMCSAVAHYSGKVASAGVSMASRQIEEAALNVVLHTLYVYNMWRHTYGMYKNHPLRIQASDLSHPQAHDCCWNYCEAEFGAQYVEYAAALTGMSVERYESYEEGRRRFFER